MFHRRSAIALALTIAVAGCTGGGSNSKTTTLPPPNVPAPVAASHHDGASIMQTSTVQIGPQGGSVGVPGVGTASFPAGAFAAAQPVTLQQISSPNLAQTFADSTAIFGAGAPAGYQITVGVGNTAPSSDTFDVVVNLPPDLVAKTTAGDGLEAFALLRQSADDGEAIDGWELFPSTYSAADKTLHVTLPSALLAPYFTNDGTLDVALTIAPTPGARQDGVVGTLGRRSVLDTTATATCEATSIASPLSTIHVLTPFGRLRKDAGGFYKLHWGTDLQAPNGTDVLAAGTGVVVTSGFVKGYGETMVIQHAFGGVRTLYAHLQEGTRLPEKTQVKVGGVIAKTGSTGNAAGQTPHLHFELAPNGNIFQKKNKVDPMACTGVVAQGDITVGDNGNLADDAFRVSIDGTVIGETVVGGKNTFATGPLRIGDHDLVIECIVAPDNVGTLGVQLSGSTVFKTGDPTTRSVNLPLGGTLSEKIVVFLSKSSSSVAIGAHDLPRNTFVEGP